MPSHWGRFPPAATGPKSFSGGHFVMPFWDCHHLFNWLIFHKGSGFGTKKIPLPVLCFLKGSGFGIFGIFGSVWALSRHAICALEG
jgi:hypothetical protein